ELGVPVEVDGEVVLPVEVEVDVGVADGLDGAVKAPVEVKPAGESGTADGIESRPVAAAFAASAKSNVRLIAVAIRIRANGLCLAMWATYPGPFLAKQAAADPQKYPANRNNLATHCGRSEVSATSVVA